MTKILEERALKQLESDPYIFIGYKVLCIVYVDELIFWEKNNIHIHDLSMQLQELGVDLEEEDDHQTS